MRYTPHAQLDPVEGEVEAPPPGLNLAEQAIFMLRVRFFYFLLFVIIVFLSKVTRFPLSSPDWLYR